jgi:hypothetical protein
MSMEGDGSSEATESEYAETAAADEQKCAAVLRLVFTTTKMKANTTGMAPMKEFKTHQNASPCA